MSEKPEKYDFLNVWIKRSEFIDPDVLNEFARLKRGMEGEKVVLDYVEKYGRKHWIVLPNLWLDYYGTFESDLLLLTRCGIYAIEIKNYKGLFQYDHGISKLNQREIGGNAIYQTRKASRNLRDLIESKFYKLNVQGVLVFIGEHNPIEITPAIDDIHVLQRNQLRDYIQKICEAEEHGRYQQQLDIEKIVAYLKSYEVDNPYHVEPISSKEMADLKKGILCAKCNQSTINISRKFIHCSCGHIELRDEAMIRTICEYGVLNFDKDLTVGELISFFNEQTSRNYLKSILKRHFKLIKRGKYSSYVNLKLPYYKLTHLFTI